MSEQHGHEEHKSATKKKPVMSRPKGFKEREDAVKNMMKQHHKNYFEWLDEQHKEKLLDFTINQYK